MMRIMYMLTKQTKQINRQIEDYQTTPVQPDTQPISIKKEASLERNQNHR